MSSPGVHTRQENVMNRMWPAVTAAMVAMVVTATVVGVSRRRPRPAQAR